MANGPVSRFCRELSVQAFWVSEDKVQVFTTRLAELGPQARITGREAVQLEGKMISMAIAIGTALIHSRLVVWALVRLIILKAAVALPEHGLQEAHLFLEPLLTRNGRTRWEKGRVVVVQAVGDSSDRMYAAFMPDGKLGAQEVRVPFTVQEMMCLMRQHFSSMEPQSAFVQSATSFSGCTTKPQASS